MRARGALPGTVASVDADAPGRSRGRRVLVLSASMGAGHDGAARELAARLEAIGHRVDVRDYLPLLPLRLGFFIRWFYGMQLRLAPSSYEWHYERCERRGPVLTISLWFARLARRRVRRVVRRAAADVVVSTYPLASQVLGTLRAEGRLRTPTATYLTDFAPHYLWVHRHVDLHLCVSGPTATAATALCGRPAVAAGPLVPARFHAADTSRREAVRGRVRAELGLPADAVVALTVAGSWGVGDVRTTVERLAAGGRVRPVVVCGRNAELRSELTGIDGAVALGWRTDMPDLMRAADVLVENAGGLTAMEAFASGLPVISHECIAGHGRDNAAAMAAQGVVRWVTEAADLVPTVLTLAGPAGGAQAARATRVFTADPADVIATLASTGSVQHALAVVGEHARGIAPLAPPSRRARRRRRLVLSSVGTGVALLVSTAGVATATEMGVGVSSGQTHHPHTVYVVVRLAAADVNTDGTVPPGLTAALRASAATVALDQQLLHSRGGAVKALARDGITLVNGGTGTSGTLDPRSPARDLVGARRDLARLPGSVPWIFVSSRRLNVLDLGTSFLADDVLVPPDTVLDPGRSMAVRGGTVLLVDGRERSEAALEDALRAVTADAAARGLGLRPLTDVVVRPG